MANFTANFLVYAVVAIFAENAIFSRALGLDRALALVDDMGNMVTFGALTSISVTITSVFTYLVSFPLQNFQNAYAWQPFIFILCMVGVYFVISVVLGRIKWAPIARRLQKIRPHLHLAMFNSAVLGALLLSSSQSYSLLQTMGFCLGSGLGFTVATVYVAEGQRKIQNRSVPRSFKGLPVTLLYIAILSLCIYGFTGYQLSF